MAMKIQKGIVEYKERKDIECLFGVTDNGDTYYFLDSTDTKKLPNGNRIATTNLTEAVDPLVKAACIGVVDEEGNVIIPFENRKIVPIKGYDDLLLVEKTVPTSQSVLDAIELRNDPSAATQLVSTSAAIKDSIANAMGGAAGQYLFNDMLSEASVFDISGNNLLEGEYYSFICMSGESEVGGV